MNIVSDVVIDGLWGDSNVRIKFDEKFNFLIGPNGTGKTTVIRLIAACLNCNSNEINQVNFTSVRIGLKQIGGSKKPSILIEKKAEEGFPLSVIKYTLKSQQTGDSESFILEETDSVSLRHFMRIQYFGQKQSSEMALISAEDMKLHISEYVDVCWLSINRRDVTLEPQSKNKKSGNSLDLKIEELKNGVARHVATLDNKYAEMFSAFQQKTFMALLFEGSKDVIQSAHLIDVDAEKQALSQVFELFSIEKKYHEKKIDRQFKEVSKAKLAISNGEQINIEHFAAIYCTSKTHTVVAEYNDLKKNKEKLYSEFKKYTSIVNEFLVNRKTVRINNKNEIEFVNNRDNKVVSPELLSSGEKQLFIILTEAFLQDCKPILFIADEPELSLHLSWQELIVESISEINPMAQIFVATHSPDIVSRFSDNIIDMEKVVDYV